MPVGPAESCVQPAPSERLVQTTPENVPHRSGYRHDDHASLSACQIDFPSVVFLWESEVEGAGTRKGLGGGMEHCAPR